MKDILVVVIVAYLAFVVGGHYVKDKCNTEYIIETYKGHFYECKPTTKVINKQVNKD